MPSIERLPEAPQRCPGGVRLSILGEYEHALREDDRRIVTVDGTAIHVLFNVAQLLQEQIGAERVYQVDASIPGAESDTQETDVRGMVRLTRTNRGLLAYAELDAVVRDTCGRCLRPTEQPLHVSLREEYLPTVDVHTGQPLPPLDEGEDAETFRVDEHHHLDLSEAVRQALVTQQPMRPLCRADCAGLCPSCGADLNESACACPEEPVDDRWSILRGLQVSEN